MAEQSLASLEADLASLRTARVELLTGGQVKEVTREGRRLVFNVASAKDIDEAIRDIEGRIAALEAEASGRLGDSDFVKTRMAEARGKTLKTLFGTIGGPKL